MTTVPKGTKNPSRNGQWMKVWAHRTQYSTNGSQQEKILIDPIERVGTAIYNCRWFVEINNFKRDKIILSNLSSLGCLPTLIPCLSHGTHLHDNLQAWYQCTLWLFPLSNCWKKYKGDNSETPVPSGVFCSASIFILFHTTNYEGLVN